MENSHRLIYMFTIICFINYEGQSRPHDNDQQENANRTTIPSNNTDSSGSPKKIFVIHFKNEEPTTIHWTTPANLDEKTEPTTIHWTSPDSLYRKTEPTIHLTSPDSLDKTTDKPNQPLSTNFGIIGGVLAVVIALGIFIFLAFQYRNRRRRLQTSHNSIQSTTTVFSVQDALKTDDNESTMPHHKITNSLSYKNFVKTLPLSQLKWEDFEILKIVGKGHFGEVYKGQLKESGNHLVAIKTLRATAKDEEWLEFVEEMKMMNNFGDHPNIVKLLGICYHQNKIFMVTEYLNNGDLNTFLRESRINTGHALDNHILPSVLSSAHLLQFALDIARGMEYLSQNQIIHRDLATRNVLIGDEGIAKISDFGLSKKGSHYMKVTQTLLPIRWLAIESLEGHIFSTKTDVWSYGVVLWEIATLGATPYCGWSTHIIIMKIKEGYRLPKPLNCDMKMYNLMLKCWAADPIDRPNFTEIMDSVTDLLANDKVYLQLIEDLYEPIDDSTNENDTDTKS